MALTIGAVVPCHNYGRFLAECLDSLLTQTHKLQQIVVVLDSCTDDSAEIAARYRFRGVRSIAANVRHPYLARRIGLQQMETDIVFFLDADDRIGIYYAQKAVEIFAQRSEVGVVTPICRSFGEAFGEWFPDVNASIEQENRCTSASAVRRAALERTAAFEQLAGVLPQDEDWFLWKHLVRGGWKIARSNGVHEHRRHRQNYSLAYKDPWAERVRREQGFQPPPPLKVAWVTPTLSTGGVTSNTLHKLRWARTVQWTTAVLIDGAPSDDRARVAIEAAGLQVIAGRPHESANAAIADRRESSRDAAIRAAREADLVYTWGHLDRELVRDMAAFCPVIFGLHGEGEWTRRSAEAIAPYPQKWYAVSLAAARCVPPEFLDRTVVIENGVDLEELAPRLGRAATRARWGLGEREIAVGYIGRVSPEKRPEAVVDALRGLPDAFRPVYVTPQADPAAVVWQHQQRALLEAKVADRGGVWESAAPDELGDVYAGLDCLVIPSVEEGGPLVMLEAFAAGLPVASTPVGLLPSLERRHGPLTERIDQPAGREAVRRAVYGCLEVSARDRAARAREVAWCHHTASRMAAEFEALCWAASNSVFRPK